MTDLRDPVRLMAAGIADLRKDARDIAAVLDQGCPPSTARLGLLHAQAGRRVSDLQRTIVRFGMPPGPDDPVPPPDFRRILTELRAALFGWPECDRLIGAQVPPQARPLHADQPAPHSAALAQSRASDWLLGQLHLMLNGQPQSDAAYDHGCFGDIALSFSTFFAAASAARRVLLARRLPHPARFLDVGCGGGLKVRAATRYFDRCDGLEYDADAVAAAQRLLAADGQGRCSALQGDALTFDRYGDYDVIYLYRPMRDRDLLEALEDRIIAQAGPGTVIIAPYAYFAERFRAAGCAWIAGHVYVTGLSQAAADDLRVKAEYTGLSPLQVETPPGSVWAPVYRSSAANGFGVEPLPVAFSA